MQNIFIYWTLIIWIGILWFVNLNGCKTWICYTFILIANLTVILDWHFILKMVDIYSRSQDSSLSLDNNTILWVYTLKNIRRAAIHACINPSILIILFLQHKQFILVVYLFWTPLFYLRIEFIKILFIKLLCTIYFST